MQWCAFCGYVAATFIAWVFPGISLWRPSLYFCWSAGRKTAQFDSIYTVKIMHGYCTVHQPCVMAQGMINRSFPRRDRLLVGSRELSIKNWQGCKCWWIFVCFLSLKLFPFCPELNLSPPRFMQFSYLKKLNFRPLISP